MPFADGHKLNEHAVDDVVPGSDSDFQIRDPPRMKLKLKLSSDNTIEIEDMTWSRARILQMEEKKAEEARILQMEENEETKKADSTSSDPYSGSRLFVADHFYNDNDRWQAIERAYAVTK